MFSRLIILVLITFFASCASQSHKMITYHDHLTETKRYELNR